jgi:hypothetical protein
LSDILDDLGFIVLDRVIASEEVARALAAPAVRTGEAPRRMALAETIHRGDGESHNQHEFAIFHHAGKTVIAKPGWFSELGLPDMEVALSRRFGVVASFHSHGSCARITRFRDGQADGVIDDERVQPEGGFFGQHEPIPARRYDTVMRVSFARYVGAAWEEIFPRRGGTTELWRFDGD